MNHVAENCHHARLWAAEVGWFTEGGFEPQAVSHLPLMVACLQCCFSSQQPQLQYRRLQAGDSAAGAHFNVPSIKL
jgi:hypothetical protein